MNRSDDERLLDELRGLLDRSAPVPPWLLQAAKEGYGWRSIDDELAELTRDSLVDRPLAAVRGDTGPRSLTFDASELTIEVEVSEAGRDRRLVGQLVPPQRARIDVRSAGTTRTVDTDQLGRFMIHGLRAQPFSLRCHLAGRRPVTTDWVAI